MGLKLDCKGWQCRLKHTELHPKIEENIYVKDYQNTSNKKRRTLSEEGTSQSWPVNNASRLIEKWAASSDVEVIWFPDNSFALF